MKVWVKVTRDRFALPEFIADSGEELARILGLSHAAVYSAVSRGSKSYLVIEIEEENEDGKMPGVRK